MGATRLSQGKTASGLANSAIPIGPEVREEVGKLLGIDTGVAIGYIQLRCKSQYLIHLTVYELVSVLLDAKMHLSTRVRH
jgi:hypothetical protein